MTGPDAPAVDAVVVHITDAVRELDEALTHLTGRHADPSDSRRETLRKAATIARGLLADALEGAPDVGHE